MKRIPANRYWLFLLIAGTGLFWDLYSKDTVFADLGFHDPDPQVAVVLQPGRHRVFDHPPGTEGQSVLYLQGWLKFRLYTSFNRGALWGIGQGKSWLFASLSVVAVLGVGYWLFWHGAAESRWLTVSLAFIMAGTLGNLYDRLAWHGYVDAAGEPIHAVRDFLFFEFGRYQYPVFNFADVFLVTGAIMLVVQSLFLMEPEQPEADREKTAAENTGQGSPPATAERRATEQKSPAEKA